MHEGHTYSESELLIQLIAGDEAAFKAVYLAHFRPLCFFADTLLQDREAAEDVVQDVLYKVWQHRADFKITGNFRSFLFTSVKNASLNYLRSAKRAGTRLHEVEYLMANNQYDMELLATREVLLDLLARELDALPPQYAAVLKMVYADGLSYDEIADRLAISNASARKLKERGLKQIRTAMSGKKMWIWLVLAAIQ